MQIQIPSFFGFTNHELKTHLNAKSYTLIEKKVTDLAQKDWPKRCVSVKFNRVLKGDKDKPLFSKSRRPDRTKRWSVHWLHPIGFPRVSSTNPGVEEIITFPHTFIVLPFTEPGPTPTAHFSTPPRHQSPEVEIVAKVRGCSWFIRFKELASQGPARASEQATPTLYFWETFFLRGHFYSRFIEKIGFGKWQRET